MLETETLVVHISCFLAPRPVVLRGIVNSSIRLSFEPFNWQGVLFRRFLRATFCVGAFLLVIALRLTAQTTSIVEGIVTDQQALPVAGAAVHITNPALGIDRSS